MNKIDSKFKDKYIHIICYDGVELNGMCENIDEHKKELQILGIKYKYNEIKQIEEYFNPIERQLLLFISKKELQFLKDRKFDITKNLTSISKQLGDYINIHDDLTNDIVICKNILIKLENMDTTGKKLYTYVSVVYDDDMIGKIINNSYYYKTDIENISIGDKVLVDRQGTETEAEVINVEYVNEDNLPFPLERTKNIIKVIGDSESSNNNFKHDDSELSDNNNFKLDDSNYYERSLLIIKDNDNFKENNCNFDSVIILPKNHNNLKSYIKNACVIITVGDVKLYNLDTKFIININNTNNKGCFTCNLTITNNDDYNSVINSIYRSIYIGGLITIDLFDIASALNGNFSFKSIEFEKSKEINNFYSLTNQKIFICICFNFCENVDYEELEKIMDKIRNKFLDADIIQYSFPVLDKKEDSKLMINLFCEEKICPNCGGKLVDILYGMPSVKSLEEADQQKIYIGGCEYSDDNPVYHCFKCNRDYYEDLVTYLTTKDSEIDSALFKELEFRNKTLSPIQDNSLKVVLIGFLSKEVFNNITKKDNILYVYDWNCFKEQENSPDEILITDTTLYGYTLDGNYETTYLQTYNIYGKQIINFLKNNKNMLLVSDFSEDYENGIAKCFYEIASKLKINIFSINTFPFKFEGLKRMNRAEKFKIDTDNYNINRYIINQQNLRERFKIFNPKNLKYSEVKNIINICIAKCVDYYRDRIENNKKIDQKELDYIVESFLNTLKK